MATRMGRKLIEISDEHFRELKLLSDAEGRFLYRLIDDIVDYGLKAYLEDQERRRRLTAA